MANDFTARVAGISVELGMSVQNKSGIWCKPTVKMDINTLTLKKFVTEEALEPNVEYMHNYYLKEVKGNAEICKRKNYSGERKAS